MKKDRAYIKINRIPFKYILFMVITSFSINMLSLALPLTMKQIYSRVVISKSKETLILLMLGCFVALLFETILRKTKESSSKWIAAKYENQLTNYILKKLLNSKTLDSESENYNINLEKLNSISKITGFFSNSFYQMFIDIPFMVIFLYFIYLLGRNIVIIPIILSCLYILFMLINSAFYFKNSAIQMNLNNKLMMELTESLEKIHLIKASGIEWNQIAIFKKILSERATAEFETNKYYKMPENINAYFSQLVLFSILCGGGYLMINGQISFGEITACALLGGRAIVPLQDLMNLYLQHNEINSLKKKIDEVEYKPDRYLVGTPIFPEDINGNIELVNLNYKNIQNNSTEVINETIRAGEFVVINPALFLSYQQILHKIIGREQMIGGKILIDNLDIEEWNMESLEGKIEYLSDKVGIFKGSILDNITYFNPLKNEDAYKASSLTGLDNLIQQMSEGFETKIDGQAINYFSTAFLQRLNLTRALIDRPRILLIERIDESMDDDTLSTFIEILQKLKGNATIVIVTDNIVIKNIANRKLF